MAISNNNPSDPNIDGVQGRPATPEEIAQRDGYVKGRNDEHYVQGNLRDQERVVAQSRANDNAASGLVFGLIIALLAAGVGAAFYFLSGDRTDVVPVAVPQIQKETTTEKETTVIERDTQPAMSLPDVQMNVPDVNVPDVNITNQTPPAPAPAAEPKAAPAPVAEPKAAPAPAVEPEAAPAPDAAE